MGNVMLVRSLRQVLLSLSSVALSSAALAANYSYTALPTLGWDSHAVAVNNVGQIAGTSSQQVTWVSGGPQRVVLWDETGIRDLGKPYAEVRALNDLGQVLVNTPVNLNGVTRVNTDIWLNGAFSRVVPTEPYFMGTDLNNAGLVVGSLNTSPNGASAYCDCGAVWDGTTLTPLSSRGVVENRGYWSTAVAVNERGQVAGNLTLIPYYADNGGKDAAAFWDTPDSPVLLPALQPTPLDLDDRNSYGATDLANGATRQYRQVRATVWDGTGATDLGGLGGSFSKALAINNLGQVVGVSTVGLADYGGFTENLRATLWDQGQVIDLNTFLDPVAISEGWVLNTAVDINDSGWIVGNASNKAQQIYSLAYVLKPLPIPEPGTWLLMALGLVGVTVASRRHQRVAD
jgi:probable HAF family extracellular repeat protein